MWGDQKVLQLAYRKLTYHIIYTVIFRHSPATSTHFPTFLLICLCPENRILCFDSHHASTTIVSDSWSVNQVPQRWYFRFLIRKWSLEAEARLKAGWFSWTNSQSQRELATNYLCTGALSWKTQTPKRQLSSVSASWHRVTWYWFCIILRSSYLSKMQIVCHKQSVCIPEKLLPYSN